MTANAYPLMWPDGWPRTQYRKRANYTFAHKLRLALPEERSS